MNRLPQIASDREGSVSPVERQLAGERLVGQHGERPAVGARVGGPGGEQLLGAHVLGRAHDGADVRDRAHRGSRHLLGDPEVQDLDEQLVTRRLGTAGDHEDVVGLDVAMDDPELVCLVQNPRDLIDDDANLERREEPPPHQEPRQGLAVETLHDEIGRAVLGHPVIERLHRVGIVELGRQRHFPLKPHDRGRVPIGQVARHQLDRDLDAAGFVLGEPNAPHASAAERTHQLHLGGDVDAGLCAHDTDCTIVAPPAGLGPYWAAGISIAVSAAASMAARSNKSSR